MGAIDLLIENDPPTFQSAYELESLLAIYTKQQPRTMLEVGTYYGGTLKRFLESTAPGATIVSVDMPPHEVNSERFQGWAAAAGQDLHYLVGDNRDHRIIEQVAAFGPYDFVFIDADHSYVDVSHDWAIYGAMARPGGIVAFHDINPREGYGVSQLWHEINTQGYATEEISAGLPGLCGIGVVHV
jgi:predicted O-methyltransferase YrrM